MPNYLKLFFLLFLHLFASGGARATDTTPQTKLLQQAEKNLLYENYESAVRRYTELYESGLQDEHTLYRLAFLHEQLQEIPESIFFLRKIQWRYGNPQANRKIYSLLEREGHSIPEGEAIPSWILLSYHARWQLLWAVLAGCLISAGVWFFPRWKYMTHAALIAGALSFLLGVLMVLSWWGYMERAVIVLETQFYEQPSYGASSVTIRASAGSTVKLLESQDIWQRISVLGQTAWVPAFTLAPIGEWEAIAASKP